jgi:GNAT superfamily N-acetyltransferase
MGVAFGIMFRKDFRLAITGGTGIPEEGASMEITKYREEYKQQVIGLILHIQNAEAGIDLQIDEQPDLLDIPSFYERNGGEFWVAVDGGEVVGTIAFMNYGNGNGVLKKFFVRADWRGKKLGLALYQTLMAFVKKGGYTQLLLDTPSVAKASHRFYEKAGFSRIPKSELPFPYEYPDRNSLLYLLKIQR